MTDMSVQDSWDFFYNKISSVIENSIPVQLIKKETKANLDGHVL